MKTWSLVSFICFNTCFATGSVLAQSACIDPDGDGWGWDGVSSCRVESRTVTTECIDTDGDGWGWNGVTSCRVNATSVTATNCIDNDGDGWGWDGTSSCRIQTVPVDSGNNEHCVDPDGDGWGWDGSKSCRADSDASNTVCVDPDGDGWGWNGVASCRAVGADAGLRPVPVTAPVIRSSLYQYFASTESIANQSGNHFIFPIGGIAEGIAVADGAGNAAGENRFSTTNIQEAGVDEADRVKLDGNLMFALQRPESLPQITPLPVAPGIASDEINVSIPYYTPAVERLGAYLLNKTESSKLSDLELENSPTGMYLHKNNNKRELILLAAESFDWSYWSSPAYFGNQATEVTWVDVSDASNMSVTQSLELDGQLVSSRKIDDQLILVTRYHPQVNGLLQPYSETVVEQNRNIIQSASNTDLLPGYRFENSGSVREGQLIGNGECYRNPRSSGSDSVDDPFTLQYANLSLISIVVIDLNSQPTAVQSTCFVGPTETIYVSTKALYLATTEYDYQIGADELGRPLVSFYPPEISTDIHKFSFRTEGAPEFRGSATVSGHLGWYAERKPYRMSEQDDYLRIVTFDQNRSGSPVTLNILSEGGGSLNIVSSLPNDARPEPLGKPGENLYASRFIGDRAYLVTFRVVDPLYILDLADPSDPAIAGELELPGYSDYLHPVSSNLLLGVGKDAIAAEGVGWGDGRGAFYQGLKLNLFDVSDPSNPFVADSLVVGQRGTDSPALYQPHAFAWLASDSNSNARMAIPMRLHDETAIGTGPAAWSQWTSNNLFKVEVDETTATLTDVPDWVFESRDAGYEFSPVSLENDRAVMGTDGGLYFIHNGSLHYGLWDSEAPVSATE